jgi:hypothetical protein
MHKYCSIIALIVAIACLPLASNAMGLVKNDNAQPKLQTSDEIVPAGQNNSSSNEQIYNIAMGMAWTQYSEDISFLNDVLNDYVTKNITRGEALQSATSLYILTSDTLNTVAQLNPSEENAEGHSNVLNALTYLKFSAWNLAKYFETNNSMYSSMARKDYNISAGFYEKSQAK